MEVLGFNFESKVEEESAQKLLNYFEIVYFDKHIVERVIILRKKYKIKLPDAIICATTIKNNAILITEVRGER